MKVIIEMTEVEEIQQFASLLAGSSECSCASDIPAPAPEPEPEEKPKRKKRGPNKPKPAPEPEPEEEPEESEEDEPEPEDPEPEEDETPPKKRKRGRPKKEAHEISLKQLRVVANKAAQSLGRRPVSKILDKYDVDNLNDLDEDQYSAVWTDIAALC